MFGFHMPFPIPPMQHVFTEITSPVFMLHLVSVCLHILNLFTITKNGPAQTHCSVVQGGDVCFEVVPFAKNLFAKVATEQP